MRFLTERLQQQLHLWDDSVHVVGVLYLRAAGLETIHSRQNIYNAKDDGASLLHEGTMTSRKTHIWGG